MSDCANSWGYWILNDQHAIHNEAKVTMGAEIEWPVAAPQSAACGKWRLCMVILILTHSVSSNLEEITVNPEQGIRPCSRSTAACKQCTAVLPS